MALAIAESQKSSEPLKCGVIISKNGEVVAQAHNSQRTDHDATAHAEIKAIATAGHKLQNKNLEGCTAFCSCEPCTMCLAALIFAKIDMIYYHTPLHSVSRNIIQVSSEEIVAKSPRYTKVVRLELD